jgi:hypothetical protein
LFGGFGTIAVGNSPLGVQSDGEDLWVANHGDGTVTRVRGADGKVLGTWTGATNATGVLVAMGRVFVTGNTSPGNLYLIDPTGVPGAVTEVTGSGLGDEAGRIAFDGSRIWTSNFSTGGLGGGSVSIITPTMTKPWSVLTVSTGFSRLSAILFDGSNMWVTDAEAGTLLKLGPGGATEQTVVVGSAPEVPVFDGTNIWVPNFGDSTVSVVRAASGTVIATLGGNALNKPVRAAFDGQRILVTNSAGDSVSLWKATDLTPIGAFSTGSGTQPNGVCSDGTYFWITLSLTNSLGRF